MAPKENLNPLKTLVISMGFLLLGGTILLGALVWKKVTSETARSHWSQECSGGKIDLTGHGSIVNTMIEGHIMRITLKKGPHHSEVVSADICTGHIFGTLSIEGDS